MKDPDSDKTTAIWNVKVYLDEDPDGSCDVHYTEEDGPSTRYWAGFSNV